jgi:NADP-dependent 3-hydroxy acid dehydrogenase YdfG
VGDTSTLLHEDAILKPEDIAQNYLWLHSQPRSAWSHEIDLRPWREQW